MAIMTRLEASGGVVIDEAARLHEDAGRRR
jgi:hypothetical protein